LIKILFRIDEMKVISSVRSLNHHDEKIAPIIEVAVAYRGLEKGTILIDPLI